MPWRRPFAVAVTLALAALLLLPAVTPAGKVSASGGCLDLQQSPVVQDSAWTTFPGNYSDFTYKYDTSSVITNGQSFVMYVRAGVNDSVSESGIFRGISPDGLSWSISRSPVLTPGSAGSWDDDTVFSPDVLWNGTGYLMYYVGDGNVTAGNFRQIGVAFSSDGIHWTKYAGNPVITHGPSRYDSAYTRGPAVIYDGGAYKMWYMGTAPANVTGPLQTVDYATSPDGVHWTKYPDNPVFTGFLEATFTSVATWPSVVKVNGTYVMAFGDAEQNIGLATSTDGTAWTFNNETGVLVTLSGWHNGVVSDPSLLVDGGRLLLWYYGQAESNLTSPYVAGIGYSACGVLVTQPSVTVTSTMISTATSISVLTKPVVVSTLISTSIATSLVQTTVYQNSGAPFVPLAIAAVLGFCGAPVLTVALLAFRVKSGAARRNGTKVPPA